VARANPVGPKPSYVPLGCLVLALVVLAVAVVGTFVVRRWRLDITLPAEQGCVASAPGGDASVTVDLEQAHLSSIIVGLSVKRRLAPRAASIAMATVYQETGIRNLDYGDRDSVGLFQQRPSQGWGSPKQLRDPYYATNKFYDALLKVKNWQNRDITEVAQQVQRSGYPDAYRDHEADGRLLASALTGNSPAGFTCLDRTDAEGDADGLLRSLEKTFGAVSDRRNGSATTIRARNPTLAWAYAHYAVANSSRYGVTTVETAGQRWQTNQEQVPEWSAASPAPANGSVTIIVR
jgi:hypothetical protein